RANGSTLTTRCPNAAPAASSPRTVIHVGSVLSSPVGTVTTVASANEAKALALTRSAGTKPVPSRESPRPVFSTVTRGAASAPTLCPRPGDSPPRWGRPAPAAGANPATPPRARWAPGSRRDRTTAARAASKRGRCPTRPPPAARTSADRPFHLQLDQPVQLER